MTRDSQDTHLNLDVKTQPLFQSGVVISKSWSIFLQSWKQHAALFVLANAPWMLCLALRPEPETVEQALPTLSLALLGVGLMSSVRLHLTAQMLEGNVADLRTSFSAVLRRAPQILALWLVCLSLGLAGLALFFVPALIFAAIYGVTTAAQVNEGLGFFDSFRRSRELTRGRRSETGGLIVTAWFLSFVCIFPLAIAFSLYDAIWRAVALHQLKQTQPQNNAGADTSESLVT